MSTNTGIAADTYLMNTFTSQLHLQVQDLTSQVKILVGGNNIIA